MSLVIAGKSDRALKQYGISDVQSNNQDLSPVSGALGSAPGFHWGTSVPELPFLPPLAHFWPLFLATCIT